MSASEPEEKGVLHSGPDLKFIECTKLPFNGQSGRISDIDGNIWNLNVAGASPALIASLARFFHNSMSRSTSPASRLRSNRTNIYKLRKFLAYAAKLPIKRQIFSSAMLKSYQVDQYRTQSSSTAYGRFGYVRAAALHLIDGGIVPKFPVPRNPNARKVAVTAKSGQTFATKFTGLAYPNANEANEDLLARLCDLLWDEIEALQQRPDLGTSMSSSLCFAACAIGLLSAACVNPTSTTELEIDDLRANSRDPSLRRLKFSKGRADGDVDLPAFPIGGTNARTIPRLWDRIIQATATMRISVPAGAERRLFLRIDSSGAVVPIDDENRVAMAMPVLRKLIAGGYPTSSGRGDKATRAVRTLTNPLYVKSSTGDQERYAPIRANMRFINYALIRNTAINVASARLKRNSADTQNAVGHRRGGGALEGAYLANRQYRDDLDQEIRLAQAALVNWATKPVRVLPAEAEAVMSEAGVDASTAARVLAEEFNLGMGASLVNATTIVIDTPLNALRMMQWVEKLEAAEARILVENPVQLAVGLRAAAGAVQAGAGGFQLRQPAESQTPLCRFRVALPGGYLMVRMAMAEFEPLRDVYGRVGVKLKLEGTPIVAAPLIDGAAAVSWTDSPFGESRWQDRIPNPTHRWGHVSFEDMPEHHAWTARFFLWALENAETSASTRGRDSAAERIRCSCPHALLPGIGGPYAGYQAGPHNGSDAA